MARGQARTKSVTVDRAQLGGDILGAVDRDIVAVLRDDPYSTNRDIGSRLGLHETEVARRIRAMDDGNSMRLMAVLDMFRAGYSMLAHARIVSQPKREREVIRGLLRPKMRQRLCALHTTDTPGLLEATFRIAAHADLAELVRSGLAGITAILKAEIDSTIAIERYRLGVAQLALPGPGALSPDWLNDLRRDMHVRHLDDLDLNIIAALQEAGRTSSRELSRRFDVTEGTIRNRLGKLDDRGLMKIIPMLDLRLVGVVDVTRVRASIRPANLNSVVRLLLDDPSVSYVSETTGSRNLHFLLTAPDLKTSRGTIAKFSKLAGVSSVTETKVRTLEFFDHRWQILSA